MIPFNKPYFTGKEIFYQKQAMRNGKISGNGIFTEQCQSFLEEKYGFEKCFLTTSGTAALEMAAMMVDFSPGDEVILPAYTFVTSALAFEREGAKPVFADSGKNHPNVSVEAIASKINRKTKAIVVVHYAGVAVDMKAVQELAQKHGLFLIEDAAQALDAYDAGKALGTFGDFSCFSFHETKNITCGEGGMFCINAKKYGARAEILWEKGTNRASFFRGEVPAYQWVDKGSSFMLSELLAGFLYAQLQELETIQDKRQRIWKNYHESLKPLQNQGLVDRPKIAKTKKHNAHLYYLVCKSEPQRNALIAHLKQKGVQAVFHYLALNRSPFFREKYGVVELPHAEKFSQCLLRLPFYAELSKQEQDHIISEVFRFYEQKS